METWEMGDLCRIACSLVATDTSSGAIQGATVPDSKNMDMPYVANGYVTWGYERFLCARRQRRVLQWLLDKVAIVILKEKAIFTTSVTYTQPLEQRRRGESRLH